MNAPVGSFVARAATILLVVVLAAGAGLAVGNLIQSIGRERSITAQASFSRDALDAVNAIRDEEPAAAAYPDYAIRHAPVAEAYPDWGLRHPAAAAAAPLSTTFRLTGPSDVDAPTTQATTDTFRLTGPSDVGGALRGQRKAD